jgi:hypothetical protein
MQVGLSMRALQSGPPRRATPIQPGRTGAANQRNLRDNERQQGTTNLEVSGRMTAVYLECQRPGVRFHTAGSTVSAAAT